MSDVQAEGPASSFEEFRRRMTAASRSGPVLPLDMRTDQRGAWGWCGGAPCSGRHLFGPRESAVSCMGTPILALLSRDDWRVNVAEPILREHGYLPGEHEETVGQGGAGAYSASITGPAVNVTASGPWPLVAQAVQGWIEFERDRELESTERDEQRSNLPESPGLDPAVTTASDATTVRP